MIYQFYHAQAELLRPLRQIAGFGANLLQQFNGSLPPMAAHMGGAWGLFAEAGLTHTRPDFGIRSVNLGNGLVGIAEEVADETAFASLVHFRKDAAITQPRVLIVAPMSGHFATLLRNTVEVMLPEHDVFITDWKNARDIALSDGCFDFDAFVDHIVRFLQAIGPGAHVVAVCQPTVATLAAVAMMAEANDPAVPRSMTLMAGPIDTRLNPTRVNEFAQARPLSWFEDNLIATVPWPCRGTGRRVYPGFLQLACFVSMNFDRHVSAYLSQFRNLLNADTVSAETHRRFYHEYCAVMDLPAEFYLQTVQRVFQEHHLPRGCLTVHGRRVRPASIRRTALLTIEGERDDICAIGQTMAALDLCSGIRVNMKLHHLQTGVGHYGVFAGKRWAREVYPQVREMIQVTN